MKESKQRTVIRVYSETPQINLSRKTKNTFMFSHPVEFSDLESITIDEKGKIINYTLISERGEDWEKKVIEGK